MIIIAVLICVICIIVCCICIKLKRRKKSNKQIRPSGLQLGQLSSDGGDIEGEKTTTNNKDITNTVSPTLISSVGSLTGNDGLTIINYASDTENEQNDNEHNDNDNIHLYKHDTLDTINTLSTISNIMQQYNVNSTSSVIPSQPHYPQNNLIINDLPPPPDPIHNSINIYTAGMSDNECDDEDDEDEDDLLYTGSNDCSPMTDGNTMKNKMSLNIKYCNANPKAEGMLASQMRINDSQLNINEEEDSDDHDDHDDHHDDDTPQHNIIYGGPMFDVDNEQQKKRRKNTERDSDDDIYDEANESNMQSPRDSCKM